MTDSLNIATFRPFPYPEDSALLGDFLLALPMLLFALTAHEVAHAWTAHQQGDDTAFKLGRITMNPLPHLDPIMSLAMPALLWFMTNGAFTFGGAKPVPIITRNFRNYVRGDLIVSSAGIVTNILLAIVCTAVPYMLIVTSLGFVPVQQASILSYLEPVSAPVYALVLLGEAPAAWTVAGGILILAGGVLVVLAGSAETAAPP
ncbi:MAG: hypothetical protein CVV20_04305 [Gemmatimonadetes bacterium HGW-Gemmatimonadetes-1]|nr:MAG: hypothetical protein CVV20_04305 [Gemmatimonadetes bacterium HGW-Gemmatimonadetes-1]